MERYTWTDVYLLQKAGVKKDFKPEWNAVRYQLGGKMFAMRGGDKDQRPILTLKLDPLLNEQMRALYTEIVPGYYANKVHWSSIYLDGSLPDETMRGLLDSAYLAGLHNLSKKQQAQITDNKVDA